MRPHELQLARASLGMTQFALGTWLGLRAKEPDRTIHLWESGRHAIPGPVARAVTTELENIALRAKLARKRK